MRSSQAAGANKRDAGAGAADLREVSALRKALPFWPWLAALSTGLLATACFAPFNQGWLCWFALTPLIAAIWFSGENLKRRWLRDLLLGYVAGIVFFTGVFGWLGSLGTLFENFWLHGLPLLLSLYLGMNFAFWSWFCGLVRPSPTKAESTKDKWSEMLERAGKTPANLPTTPWLRSTNNLWLAFLLASAWSSHEWIRGWLFGGFGWNGLGIALWDKWPLVQIAEFTGVIGLSFVIVFVNVIVVTIPLRLFHEARTHRMRPHWDINFTMLGVVGLLVFGWQVARNPSQTSPLRVAAIQASIPQKQKFDPQFSGQIFDRFTRLSEVVLSSSTPPELLIWPESALPGPLLEDEETYRFVMDFAASSKTGLLLGTIDVENGHEYNAAALVSNSGQQVQIYRKLHLVPFGEYIPLRHSFPLFAAVASRWVPGDFEAGQNYTVFRLTNGDVQVAPLICFEDTIGELTRQFVLKGANLLANVTNDGWFLHSAGSQQHLANAVFRCVETRRPMVRAANTGVTCFVNEFGRVTQLLQDETGGTFAEGVLAGEVNVPTERDLTFYVRHGELFAKFCAAVTLIAIIVGVIRRRWL
ncbi:MAG: apolipoprotein N-acyltransferase [Verrucomicrobia bacterium]|nr:MAG: apolipoprotein N-acyltransferase [Verrucomicrobiota bacterium]